MTMVIGLLVITLLPKSWLLLGFTSGLVVLIEESMPLSTSLIFSEHQDCRGYWEGYVGVEVCNRWNGDPIDEAETIALEQLIAEQPDFLEKNCEFVGWPPTDFR
jgi:hypothetical protein